MEAAAVMARAWHAWNFDLIWSMVSNPAGFRSYWIRECIQKLLSQALALSMLLGVGVTVIRAIVRPSRLGYCSTLVDIHNRRDCVAQVMFVLIEICNFAFSNTPTRP